MTVVKSEESPKYVVPPTADVIESVVIGGDLEKLSTEQRVSYYQRVCQSLGLNPLTKPFDYIRLNGRLTLYARRDAADQLRKRDGVSVQIVSREKADGVYIVQASATMPDGRTDEAIGAVNVDGLKGDALANALMKAETKAKRRVTLSICGLGWLDETEVESIPDAQPVAEEPPATAQAPHWCDYAPARARFWAWAKEKALRHEDVHRLLGVESIRDVPGTEADCRAAISAAIAAEMDKAPQTEMELQP